MRQKDVYFVAVKIFLRKGNKLLILRDNFGDWDLPGGRITKGEFATPIEKIIKRKMREELGGGVVYTVGKLTVLMRHQRVERAPGNPMVRIFAVGYDGRFKRGEIILSKRHSEMLWVDLKRFKPEKYFAGGWLEGVKEYLKKNKNH